MAHEDAGHYAAKHPQNTELNAAVAAEIKNNARDGAISCAAAHAIAVAMNVAPDEVGRNLDLLEVRLTKCQLGLFGYTPQKKIVAPAARVASDLKAALTAAATDGRLACDNAWQLAAAKGIARLEVAAACETLGLKIKPCQLGAF